MEEREARITVTFCANHFLAISRSRADSFRQPNSLIHIAHEPRQQPVR